MFLELYVTQPAYMGILLKNSSEFQISLHQQTFSLIIEVASIKKLIHKKMSNGLFYFNASSRKC